MNNELDFFDLLADWIRTLCDALSGLSLSFLGYDISFYKLVLIVFFGGSAFDIIFSHLSDIDEEYLWDDDDI